MVKKILRIGLHEISTIDVTCGFCKTRVQYHLDTNIEAKSCPSCNKDYEKGVREGIMWLRDAFGHLHQDKKHTTAFEIELED